MKILKLLLISLIFLVSCGQEPVSLTRPDIVARVVLPASLIGNSALYERFLSRVRYLSLKLKSKEGMTYETHFPPDQWNKIPLPQTSFPESEKDSLTIQFEIWDRKLDGTPRSYPALTGKKELSAKDAHGYVEVPVKLSLQVTVESFD